MGATPSGVALDAALSQLPVRDGIPARDSIVGITTPVSIAVAAAGGQYRLILTNEVDEYEEVETSPQGLAAAAKKLPTGDGFKGTSRKAAKLSIATAQTENFSDLRDLIESLAPEITMTKHKPPIGQGATANRVKEEKRNIRVRAFIYGASRENDNDYHLIIGRDPEETPEMYMTMELSGLPPSSSSSFKKLKAARDAFKKFYNNNLGGNLPGTSYQFPDPPIPVEIEGSLFFDITHATGSRAGPKSLKSRMPGNLGSTSDHEMTFES